MLSSVSLLFVVDEVEDELVESDERSSSESLLLTDEVDEK